MKHEHSDCFDYLSGKMTPEEQSTFEQQLETDEQLRMALNSPGDSRARSGSQGCSSFRCASLERLLKAANLPGPGAGDPPVLAPWLGL